VRVGAIVVQVTDPFVALVTVHVIAPVGAAPPVGPVTTDVNVIDPPRVGVPDEVNVTVGTTWDTPRVNGVDVTVK